MIFRVRTEHHDTTQSQWLVIQYYSWNRPSNFRNAHFKYVEIPWW